MTAAHRITIALAVGALACGAAAAPVAAQQRQPDQVIDSKADPQTAGQTLNDLCATLSNCQWSGDAITAQYGPVRILGDVTYNCSPTTNTIAYNEASSETEETRSETTSIGESVSLKVSLGFLDLAKSSVEAKATSDQASTFTAAASDTDAVTVPPGYKGLIYSQALGYTASGSAYITDGIKLIEVTGIDLDFPGYVAPDTTADTTVRYDVHRWPMTDDDLATNCNAINGLQSVVPPTSFSLDVCSGGSCAARRVTGPAPPNVRKGRATLTQDGRTVATGTVARGRTAITPTTALQPGQYELTFHTSRKTRHHNRYRLKAPKGRRLTKHERRLRKWERHSVHTHIPITIG